MIEALNLFALILHSIFDHVWYELLNIFRDYAIGVIDIKIAEYAFKIFWINKSDL
jgi:hypothetical protein